jgi:hypothetical protein
MTTGNEYRQFAAECMRAAREAKTDTERKVFIDMVRAWTQAAEADGAVVPVDLARPDDSGRGPSH